MGGICGFVDLVPQGAPIEGAPRGGAPPGAAAGRRRAMVEAMAHRGGVSFLDEATPLAIDSAFNGPDAVATAWSESSGVPGEFAARLEGSFAVAALDRRRGRLVLARDRLGEKPLYYAASPSGIAFASEIKALRAAGAVADLTLSPEALDAYFAFNYIPAPWTIFSSVRKVPAAHAIGFDFRPARSGSQPVRPGSPPAHSGSAPEARAIRYFALPDRTGESATPEQLLALLREALRRRLPEAGKAAALLSGGLDSSVVVALMGREGGSRIPTFSVGFDQAHLDDSAHAREIARLLGTDHHELRLTEVDAGLVGKVIEQLDEPMADAAAIPTYVLARAAASVARVVMTGDGADALLAGDHWFRRVRRLDRLGRLPRPVTGLVPPLAALAGRRQYRRYRLLASLLDLPPAERYLRIREKWTPSERSEIYSEEFRRRLDAGAAARTYTEAPVEWKPGASLDAALRLDALHGLPEDLLMKADKMGMAHGVESRSPFLDQSLAEWAARVDLDLLLRGSTSKYLLKRAAEPLLPREVVYRRKHGLQVPVGRWLRGSLRELTEDAFDESRIRRQGIFDPASLAALKARFEGLPPGAALDGRVWQIVAFQTWWRQVFEA